MTEEKAVEPTIVAKFADRLAELNPRVRQIAKNAEELVGRPCAACRESGAVSRLR